MNIRQGHPALRADFTLTMGLPKLCLYLPHARVLCGRIMVIHVGFPPPLLEDPEIPGELLLRRAWRKLAPPIAPDTYKNRRGHLAVFAGVARNDRRRVAERKRRGPLTTGSCYALRGP